ncbi:MAG: hypothetical protein ACLFSM_08155 [Thermoplasmata archaeon]
MHGINEWGEGSMNDFGRYMVLLVLFEPLAIYTLLIFELGLVFSGMLGTDVSLSMGSADMYMYGALVLGLSCSTSLLMSWAFHRLEEPLNENVQLFKKKVMYMGFTHIPVVVGLMVAVVLMIQSGMI